LVSADAIDRFKTETLRVYVLELHLSGSLAIHPREYFAGDGLGKFSIADINAYPWVRTWKQSKMSEEEMENYPHLKEWIDRIGARTAVQRGISDIYDEEVHPELLVSTASK
jgi:glutathione S-transferase